MRAGRSRMTSDTRGGETRPPFDLALPYLSGLRQPCKNCGGDAPVWDVVCPDCGHQIVSSRRLRVAGVIYLVFGLAIAGALFRIMAWCAWAMAQTGKPGATAGFSGTRLQAIAVFGVLGTVCLFGVSAIAMGVWQMLRGSRHRVLVRMMIGWYLLFWAVYGAVWVKELLQ